MKKENRVNSRGKGRWRVAAVVLVVSIAVVSVACWALSQPPLDGELSQRLDDYVQALNQACENQQVSGCLLITKKGKIVAANYYGMADYREKRPFSQQTRFLLCSTTKMFTALGVLQLYEKGQLHLDDPIAQYFPEQHWQEAVTIRQLLTHTAGVLRDVTDLELISPYEDTDRSVLLTLILKSPLLFQPGTDMVYSNAGYQLLAGMIERVSGLSYEEYLNKHIFAPAKMKNTGCSDMADVENLAAGHEFRYGVFYEKIPFNLSHALGSGNIYTTPYDMALFDKALLQGTLVKAKTLAQMTVDNTGQDKGYGLGCFVGTFEGNEWFGHSGNFTSGYFSHYVHFPQEGVGVIMLFNTQWNDNMSIMKAICSIALERLCPIMQKRQRLSPESVDSPHYEGVYESSAGQAMTVKSVDGLLYAQSDRTALLIAFGENRFYDSLNEYWEYTFETDGDGKATCCVVSNGFDTIRLEKKEGNKDGR